MPSKPKGRPMRCTECGHPINANNVLGICTVTPRCQNLRQEIGRRAAGIAPRQEGRSRCAVEGCTRIVHARGLCEAHDERVRKHGETGPAEIREISRVRVRPGEQYGAWTVLGSADGSVQRVLCRCKCGAERRVLAGNLATGSSRSCGCARTPPERTEPYMRAGEKHGRLTAQEDAWLSHDSIAFLCECGKVSSRPARKVRYGTARSCCGRGDYKHGLSHHTLYRTWAEMMSRTGNPGNHNFARYGGRGITVCERWQDVAVFVADIEREIGPRPDGVTLKGAPVYTLDRIDNDGGYEPGNIKWATAKEQAANRRTIGVVTAQRDALLSLLLTIPELANAAQEIVSS